MKMHFEAMIKLKQRRIQRQSMEGVIGAKVTYSSNCYQVTVGI
jgi:hypothetical protein